jgi:TolB-like protein/tetratricopeptide (TPR) repeat protein
MILQATGHITLTVLPFEDLSLHDGAGTFCRSFSSDLVTELSRFRQFHIISLPFQVEESEPASTKFFDSLQTDYFIQGSFRSEKEIVRINVQLYESETHHMVWGHRMEGELKSLNEIQDNLLSAVVGVLQHQINHDLLSRLRKRPKVEFRAYEHWLNGMEEVRKGSVETDLLAREQFQKALEIQPDYSLAYTGMSLTYFNEWSCQLWDRWDVCKTGAYEWVERAIELDDQNYIAAMVLGKILMYDGSYDTAEYYLRKSLLLNPNDSDTLIQMAFCFLFMGFEKEAIALYEKAMKVNPLNSHRYFPYGAFLYFELGDYEKAASLIMPGQKTKVASADAYYAAICFYLQRYDKMQSYWDLFLDNYRRLISKGNDFTLQEAVDWIMKIGPYRYTSRLEKFLRYIGNVSFEKRPQQTALHIYAATDNYFSKDTAAWKLSYNGLVVQVAELKGFYDIQKMLMEPRQLFHCAELMGSAMNGKGEKLIDEKARRQYQQKILELQSDMQEAENHSDFARAEKLQEEYDQLIDYLSQSLGLKGKSRESGGTVEKARSAITWRIRNAIARIEQHHPLLGAHLSNAIKTGTLCSYQPDRDINWITT